MDLVKEIGDIAIYSADNFVTIRVDGETVIAIPRAGHGLDDLADTLKGLVK